MTQREDHLKLLILDLLSAARSVAPDALINLDEAEQAALLKDIRDHRLGPMLRYMHQSHHAHVVFPVMLIDHLEQSHRRAVFRSLHIQQALHHLDSVLRQMGVPYMALKGAFLAFHAYPNPALRPMRDIDILVPEDRAMEAFLTLLAEGYQRSVVTQGDVAAYFALSHQLPPLMSPHGNVSIEIHHRIANPQKDRVSFTVDDAFRERSIRLPIGGRLIPLESPTDLLRHLIHHAVYHHQFDVGPLFIPDVAYLLTTKSIDWPLFWRLIESDQMLPGALLALYLTQLYWPDVAIIWPDVAFEPPPAEILHTAKIALLGDHEHRAKVMLRGSFAARSLNERACFLMGKLFPKRKEVAFVYPVDSNAWQAYASYLPYYWRLLTELIPKFFSIPGSRHGTKIQHIQQLQRWLTKR